MAELKFKHEDKNFTVKGSWDKDTFTAQAWQGKKEASDVFSMEKSIPKDGELADDDALAGAVMQAVKNHVINGGDDEE